MIIIIIIIIQYNNNLLLCVCTVPGWCSVQFSLSLQIEERERLEKAYFTVSIVTCGIVPMNAGKKTVGKMSCATVSDQKWVETSEKNNTKKASIHLKEEKKLCESSVCLFFKSNKSKKIVSKLISGV